MTNLFKIVSFLLVMTPLCAISRVSAGETVLKAKHTTDFVITGDGSAANWNNTEWLVLPQRNKQAFPIQQK